MSMIGFFAGVWGRWFGRVGRSRCAFLIRLSHVHTFAGTRWNGAFYLPFIQVPDDNLFIAPEYSWTVQACL
jgi:hypothetical protein